MYIHQTQSHTSLSSESNRSEGFDKSVGQPSVHKNYRMQISHVGNRLIHPSTVGILRRRK